MHLANPPDDLTELEVLDKVRQRFGLPSPYLLETRTYALTELARLDSIPLAEPPAPTS